MKNIDIKLYAGLIITLSVSAFIYTLLPMGDLDPNTQLPASKPILGLINAFTMLILYGGLGFLGMYFSSKNGFPSLWNDKIKNNILEISLVGIGIGVVFIISDLLFSQLFSFEAIPHPPFPTSVFASINAGIGEEIIFRLFFISLWIWALSRKVTSEEGYEILFGIVAAFSAIAFSIGHIPSVMYLYNYESIFDIPLSLMIMIFWLNGLLSFFATYYFRTYGFLSAVLIHFWTDIFWHVIYGGIVG